MIDHTVTAYKFQMIENGESIVTIKPTGEVEVNPKFTLDDAAKAFWDAVRANNPALAQQAGADQTQHLLCWAYDNLNDMPISEKRAAEWCKQAESFVVASSGPGGGGEGGNG